jgi:excisionase family DNA binding protein
MNMTERADGLRERRAPGMLDEKFLTVADLEECTAMSASWWYAAAESGRVPSIKVGKYVRFIRSEIEAWLESQRRGPRAKR